MIDIKKGETIKLENKYYTVLDFSHQKLQGRSGGGASIRLRLKDLRSGAVLEKTLSAEKEIETVKLEERPAEYLYKERDTYYFMDKNNYEQIPISADIISEEKKYLKENIEVFILFAEKELLGIKLPNFCELKVIDTEPPLKGARISGGLKPATLETGAKIQVPMFIEVGDIVKVDTRDGSYVERIK